MMEPVTSALAAQRILNDTPISAGARLLTKKILKAPKLHMVLVPEGAGAE
jgi:hypothetical protein